MEDFVKLFSICHVFQSFFSDEDMSIAKKFKLYVEDNWNKCDMVAISLFIIGVSCRYCALLKLN